MKYWVILITRLSLIHTENLPWKKDSQLRWRLDSRVLISSVGISKKYLIGSLTPLIHLPMCSMRMVQICLEVSFKMGRVVSVKSNPKDQMTSTKPLTVLWESCTMDAPKSSPMSTRSSTQITELTRLHPSTRLLRCQRDIHLLIRWYSQEKEAKGIRVTLWCLTSLSQSRNPQWETTEEKDMIWFILTQYLWLMLWMLSSSQSKHWMTD